MAHTYHSKKSGIRRKTQYILPALSILNGVNCIIVCAQKEARDREKDTIERDLKRDRDVRKAY